MVVVFGDFAEVDVGAEEEAALAGDVEDVALGGVDDRLEADIGEVSLGDNIGNAPRMVGDLALVGGSDGASDVRSGAVRAEDVLGADLAGLPLVRSCRVEELDLDGLR